MILTQHRRDPSGGKIYALLVDASNKGYWL